MMEKILSRYKTQFTEYYDNRKKSLSKTRLAALEELQQILKVNFRNISLLDKALTHRSYTNENSSKKRAYGLWKTWAARTAF